MPLIDDAIATYESAARVLSQLLNIRTDMFSNGLAALSAQANFHLAGGYKDVGPDLSVCLPAMSRATISRSVSVDAPAGAPPSLEVLTSDLDWMTFEGWLENARARTCFVAAEIRAERAVMSDVFKRSVGPGSAFHDSQPVEGKLPLNGPAVLEVPLEAGEEERAKIVIHLRRPPERMILRSLSLLALP